MITYHKSVSDDGGNIGDVIQSGVVGALLPEISLSQQELGAIVYRKFYIANSDPVDVPMVVEFSGTSTFPVILFASNGDSEVLGDLSGFETDETPLSVTIPASGHLSFWFKETVAEGSTVTDSYDTIDIKTTN